MKYILKTKIKIKSNTNIYINYFYYICVKKYEKLYILKCKYINIIDY